MDRSRNFWLSFVAFIVVVLGFIFIISYFDTHYKEYDYALSELEPNVYCLYNSVSSRVPSENYEMVTLCCNGSLLTFKGSVSIVYQDNKAQAIIRDYNMVNSDEIFVYVPQNTVKFQENIGV